MFWEKQSYIREYNRWRNGRRKGDHKTRDKIRAWWLEGSLKNVL
jgi:hypothetical protein